MNAYKFPAFKILLICLTLVGNLALTFGSEENLEEEFGEDYNATLLNDDLYILNSSLESHYVSQLEKAVDSLIIKHIALLEKRLQSHNEAVVVENIKAYMQSEIHDLKSLPEIEGYDIKCSDNRLPQNCLEVKECNKNVFSIMIPRYSKQPFNAACDMATMNGGWTIIQKRLNGSENFNRKWTDYVKGFGNTYGEFFIGLEKLHALTTTDQPQELYIILEDFEGTRKYAMYKEFKVESESTEFMLKVSNYSGNAGDSLTQHNNCTFSTSDFGKETVCGKKYKSGWWFNDCLNSNLNGLYLMGSYEKSKYGQGISWGKFRGYQYSLKFVQMMIRDRQEDD